MHEKTDLVRRLSVISLFIDNDLLEKFVLKGGNAISLAFGNNNRASTDIDVSMAEDFSPEELEQIAEKLQHSFEVTFEEEGLKIYDFKFFATPKQVRKEYESFWGGYTIEFKCIEIEKFKNDTPQDLQRTRTTSIAIGETQERKFTVDISKYEYVKRKEKAEIDGYTIYVYTPVMVVYEKLRAICQQMKEYGEYVETNRKPRAKDFFDIHSVVEEFQLQNELYEADNIEMLREIFRIKKVPLTFLLNLENYRDFHRDNFRLVEDTVSGGRIETYDYYFDYVDQLVQPINSILEEEESREITG